MMNEEVTFKLNESEVLASDNAKKEEMTSRRVSTADRREGENSSQQSALLEHHLLDFFSEQQKINKIAHDRVNSCCTKSQKILSEFETIPRGSEVEESPRELEFKMTMKPMHPVSQRETDYAPR